MTWIAWVLLVLLVLVCGFACWLLSLVGGMFR